ncbi:Crp/Fnr family transcriptional regulator [Fulvivirga sp. 29W222]|uniref:Crp/Fnr family transcriptional regulator n=2 Tax=Fulvivirga marina TaxID=2494733 RepID=A0A937KCZ9_9BACT|nr:Crp/Fnr family transcriptional regulator [Fulvivirga marina]
MDKCLGEVSLTEEELQAISAAIEIRAYKAGTILLEAGEIATECYLNLKGCVRQYYFIDGEEKTTFFYTEDQPIASFASATKKMPSTHYLSCVEDTVLSVMSFEKEEKLYKKYPRFESLCRIGVEEQLGDYQEILAKYITSSPEERYLNLLETRPDLLNRVPQYQLASYLGVKPESLSRIRKRIMLKPGVNVKLAQVSMT